MQKDTKKELEKNKNDKIEQIVPKKENKLFGTDGIRGKAGEKLDAYTALHIAMAAGIYFREHSITNKIIVGKDTRRSGYMIENAVVCGLTAVGYSVRQTGPMPTPAIAFLTQDLRCDAGIMISASHNDYYDNGIKFFNQFGDKLNIEDEKKIEEIFFDKAKIQANQKKYSFIGKSKRVDDFLGRYIVQIKNSFPKNLNLHGYRIVVDAANGAGYKVSQMVFSELGAECFVINNEPSGININSNCGALHPEKLGEKVKEYRADIGFALDGDADRLIVVNEKGEKVNGDILIAVLALYLKENNLLRNNIIVATQQSNWALDDYLKERGIEVKRSEVGDKNVLDFLKKYNSNFGAEESGHIIFHDYSKTGDSLVASMQVLATLIKSGKKASEILEPFELYPQLVSNLAVNKKPPYHDNEEYKKLVQMIREYGIKDLFRYSGTENILRLKLQSKDPSRLEEMMEKSVAFFKKFLNV